MSQTNFITPVLPEVVPGDPIPLVAQLYSYWLDGATLANNAPEGVLHLA